MSIKTYIKRGLSYVLHGTPIKNIQANITVLGPGNLLKGRTAFITGGTSGIGYCIARSFLENGAFVVITGRDKERLNKSCKSLEGDGQYKDRVFGVQMDNRNIVSFNTLFKEVLSLLGGRQLDILVNNAGILGGHISETTEEEYDDVMDTNLKGAFFLSRIVGQYMKNEGIKGNILNIASSSSLRPAVSAYTLSKWGIRGLTMGLARSLAPYGIIVNGIAPGQTATPMLIKDKSRGLATNNLLGRFILPEEIASMAVVLVSGLGHSIMGDIVYMTGGSALLSYEDMNYNF